MSIKRKINLLIGFFVLVIIMSSMVMFVEKPEPVVANQTRIEHRVR